MQQAGYTAGLRGGAPGAPPAARVGYDAGVSRHSAVWIVLGTLAGGAAGFAISWALAADDIHQLGDWRAGAQRFIGFATALGLFTGFAITTRITRGKRVTRDGFTLSYRRIEPTATGYRELSTLAVEDLLAGLRRVGYTPRAAECDDTGAARGPIEPTRPLAGANVVIGDPRVRGSIRVQLAPPPEGVSRAMGLVEIWSEHGGSAEELALFTLQVLDGMVGDLTASRESSQLGQDPVSLLTAGLDERPRALR